jgi:ketosteroid isomerase-like protein
MRFPPIFALALAGVAVPAIADTGAPVAVDAFHAALKAGDRAAALALLADDVLIFESGHAEQSKEEYIAGHVDADMEFEAATKSTISQRRVMEIDDVAWVASEGHTTGKFRGKDVNSMSTETMVLRRFGNDWKIVHIHWSSGSH